MIKLYDKNRTYIVIRVLFIILFQIIFLQFGLSNTESNSFQYRIFVLNIPENWNIDSILINEQYLAKKDYPEKKLSTINQNKPIWLQVNIKNKTFKISDLIIFLDNTFINEIDFFEIKDNRIFKSKSTGEKRVKTSDKIKTRNYNYCFTLDSTKDTKIYIRVYNLNDVTYIPINITTYTNYLRSINKSNLFLASFYGALVIILILNLSLFFSVKKIEFIYYSAYVFCLLNYFLLQDGISFTYLWPNSPTFSNRSLTLILSSIYFFLIIFAQYFFKLKTKMPSHNRVFNILKYAILIFGAIGFINDRIASITVLLNILTILFIYGTLIYVTLKLARDNKLLYLLSITFTLWIYGVTIYLLRDYGRIEDTIFVENVFRFIYLSEAIAMFIVILQSHFLEIKLMNTSLTDSNQIIRNQNDILERQNEELSKLYTATNETDSSIAFFDENKKLLWCNKKFIALRRLNYATLELKKVQFQIQNFYVHFDEIDNVIIEAEDKHKPQKFEWKLKTKNEEFWFHTNLTPLLSGRRTIGFITVDTDISPLKKYEKELITAKAKAEESDKLKSAFLANMSHEIRTPMNAIFGFTHLLRRKLSNEKRDNYINVISANGEYLIKLIDDIIDISKIEAGQLEINLEWFDVNSLLEDINLQIEHYSRNFNKEHLTISHNNKDNIEQVYTDRFRLQQVLINLITNAIKFTDNGYVKYGVNKKDKHLIFYVEDSGIGIDKKHQAQIFERFIKIDSSKKILYRGTGIGLSISQHIIHLLDGEIFVKSELEVGSTFFVKLPLYKPIEELKNKKVQNKKITAKDNLSILIAEDENDSFEYLRDLLELYNYNVYHAINGKEAINILDSDKDVDIILMDLKMPDMDGYETIKIIKQKYPKIPVIAQTAHAMQEEKEKIFKVGFDEYISKPIKEPVLLNKINQLIG